MNLKACLFVFCFTILCSYSPTQAQSNLTYTRGLVLQGPSSDYLKSSFYIRSKDITIFAGRFGNDSITIGTSTFPYTSAGGYAMMFIGSVDQNSNTILWANAFQNSEPSGLSCDSTYCWITGSLAYDTSFGGPLINSTGGIDAFLLKIFHNGTHSQTIQFAGPNIASSQEKGVDVAVYQNSVYVVGNFLDNITIGSQTLKNTNAGFWDWFVAKLDQDGTTIWARAIGTFYSDESRGIAVSTEGGSVAVFVTGYFTGDFNIDGFSFPSDGDGVGDALTLRLNDTGYIQWYQVFSSIGLACPNESTCQFAWSFGASIAVGPNSEVYVAGLLRGQNVTPAVFEFQGVSDGFIANLSPSNGSIVWASTVGGPKYDEFRHLSVDNSYIYVTGYYRGAPLSNPPNLNMPTTTTDDGAMMTLKFDPNGTVIWAYGLNNTGGVEGWSVQASNDTVYVAVLWNAQKTNIIGGTLPPLNTTNAGWIDIALMTYSQALPSPTPSISASPSRTPSISASPSRTPSISASVTPSHTPSITPSTSVSSTPSVTASRTPTPMSPSVTPSPSTNSTDSASSARGHGSSTGAIIGGVVGGVLGLLLVLSGIVFLFIKKRKSNHTDDNESGTELRTSVIQKDPEDPVSLVYDPLKTSPPPAQPMKPVESSGALSRWEIDFKKITIEKQIGQGGFGVIYLAKWRNQYCVVKMLDNRNSGIEFFKESNNVMHLRPHPNICAILGVCCNPEYPFCLVMEYIPNGSLWSMLINKKLVLDTNQVIEFALDIASGMSHLHSENVIHCDLACRNLLVGARDTNNYMIKITDFGLSRISDTVYNANAQSVFPVRWSAPEVLTQKKVSKAADVWSYAVTLWEMIEAKEPYFELISLSEVVKGVTQGVRLSRPTAIAIPDKMYEMMSMCWNADAEARPSFETICQILESVKKEQGLEKEAPKQKQQVGFVYNNATYGNKLI